MKTEFSIADGIYAQVLEQVFCSRIRRDQIFYTWKVLGAYNDDLTSLAKFFIDPWDKLDQSLPSYVQAALFNWVAMDLRSAGRLKEAADAQNTGFSIQLADNDFENIASAANNLAEIELALGNTKNSIRSMELSVRYSDLSKSTRWIVAARTTLADVLHQTGRINDSLRIFKESEILQKKLEPRFLQLYSLQFFRYCDLLTSINQRSDVLLSLIKDANYSYELANKHIGEGLGLLDIGLGQLAFVKIYLKLYLVNKSSKGKKMLLDKAFLWVNKAIASLCSANTVDSLPLGLLARAALFRHTHEFDKARQDLQEVFDIAEPSGMRLHLTDYHLEMARLLVAEAGAYCIRPLQHHIAEAARLIEATGYHRRDAELAKLQQHLG